MILNTVFRVLVSKPSVPNFVKKQQMKTTLLLGIFIGAGFTASAQLVEDSIEMMPGYTNESYYSLANDEQANIDNTNWDIAFDLGGFGSSVRTNEHVGTEVYEYTAGSDWTTVDTTGMSWNTFHNSETTWSLGSFDQAANPSDPFDIGWGDYNVVTHQIIGSRIYIVKLASGDYKKVMIESLISGTYTFKHADISGSNEVSNTITKSGYTDKNFVYYSITNDVIIDREPANDSWDIVFTKYSGLLPQGVNYGVTGVLANNGVYVREANGVDPSSAIWTDYAVDSVINVIGWDWKSFNGTTFSYDITPDLSYFVQDKAGDIWHLLFTKFEGGSTGKVVFSKEKVSTADVDDLGDVTSFGIYPNPADDQATVVYNTSSEEVNLSIIDLGGSIVMNEQLSEKGFVSHKISLNDLKAGTYFVRLSTTKTLTTAKLFVR